MRVAFQGDADMSAVEDVRAALANAHERALRERSMEVVVDLTALEFMNSTCLKAFLTWLGTVDGLEPGTRYRIRFLSSAGIPWQRRSLHALVAFAPDLVTVEVS